MSTISNQDIFKSLTNSTNFLVTKSNSIGMWARPEFIFQYNNKNIFQIGLTILMRNINKFSMFYTNIIDTHTHTFHFVFIITSLSLVVCVSINAAETSPVILSEIL